MMNIGYPDTKNKQRSGDCGCGSPLYITTDFTPEVIETSYEGNLDLSGLENALTKKKTTNGSDSQENKTTEKTKTS